MTISEMGVHIINGPQKESDILRLDRLARVEQQLQGKSEAKSRKMTEKRTLNCFKPAEEEVIEYIASDPCTTAFTQLGAEKKEKLSDI